MSRAGRRAACGDSAWGPCPRPTMNLEGLEMVAVLVVLALFVKVLEQFGLFEPVSLEGNPGAWAALGCWLEGQRLQHWGGATLTYDWEQE